MALEIEIIQNLYKSGLSVPVIAKHLNVSQWSIYKTMHKLQIELRTPRDSNNLRFLAQPLGFKIKSNLTSREQDLKIAGLMLYWAEGYKRSDSLIDFTNSDPEMIILYLKFLRTIYGIDERKLRGLLYCYSNQSIDALLDYWSRLTGIPETQFTKPYIRKDFMVEKIDRMPQGMIHVRYNDKRLLHQIMEDIETYVQSVIRWGGGAVNRTRLS